MSERSVGSLWGAPVPKTYSGSTIVATPRHLPAVPEEARVALEKLRKTIKAAALVKKLVKARIEEIERRNS